MATIIPQSELLKQALGYICDGRKEQPEKSLSSLLDEAGMRFNLSPADTAALERLFADMQTQDTK